MKTYLRPLGLAILAIATLFLGQVQGQSVAGANDSKPQTDEILVIREALLSKKVGARRRWALPEDSVVAQIVSGAWKMPQPGKLWTKISADKNGVFKDSKMRGVYVAAKVSVKESRTMILEARGHSLVYVNGEPRVGDVYNTNWVRLPVKLKAGDNEFLFRVARGMLSARLVPAKSRLEFSGKDDTKPDAISGEKLDSLAAVVILNNQDHPISGAHLMVQRQSDGEIVDRVAFSLPALGVRKVGFRIVAPAVSDAETKTGPRFNLILTDASGEFLAGRSLALDFRKAGDAYRSTFRSEIDGSVQYYAVRPAKNRDQARGLVLTVHGASVEAISQARAYSQKDDLEIVAATNRRPFGFDWEDWGRLDAIEVLELAKQRLKTTPSRTYLTGHSMGGHGSWHLASIYPDRFAAVAPSAGWVSMFSYAGAKRDDVADGELAKVRDLLYRCMNGSDTLARKRNYADMGVYVLHGDADDNVPVTEARQMKKELASTHADFGYHEQKGAGHWWDGKRAKGADCVDWPEIFEMFGRRRLASRKEIFDFDFATSSPGLNGRHHWLTIESQLVAMGPSRVKARFNSEDRILDLETKNVLRLSIIFGGPAVDGNFRLRINGADLGIQELNAKSPRQYFALVESKVQTQTQGKTWQLISNPGSGHKSPQRYGPLKEGFRHRAVLVYGTKGSTEERAWALAKARYDAETFYYRGNGSFEVIPDSAFNPAIDKDRSVVLYGNADTNSAWNALLVHSPIEVKSDHLSCLDALAISKRGDLSCFFIRPRPGSDQATVTAIGGTGISGMRACDRIPVFVSGVGLPDFMIFQSDLYESGIKSVLAAGFFADDWTMQGAEVTGVKK